MKKLPSKKCKHEFRVAIGKYTVWYYCIFCLKEASGEKHLEEANDSEYRAAEYKIEKAKAEANEEKQ